MDEIPFEGTRLLVFLFFFPIVVNCCAAMMVRVTCPVFFQFYQIHEEQILGHPRQTSQVTALPKLSIDDYSQPVKVTADVYLFMS